MLCRLSVLILGIWAPLLLGVAAVTSYLSEKENWNVEYVLEPHSGCSKGPGYYAVANLETDVARMREGKTDCKLFLQVNLKQNATYNGIAVDTETHMRGFAVGENTAAKIFGSTKLFKWAHTNRWWMTLHISSSDQGVCGPDRQYFIKKLDSAVATSAAPSIKSNWTPVSARSPLYRLPVPMWEGGFQIAEFIKTNGSCQQLVTGANVTFYINLQEKKHFLQVATQATVEYHVLPFCVPELANTACRSGALSVSDVRKCASELHLQDSSCPLKVEARVVQDNLHDGMVYDAEGSTTAVVSLRKEFLLTALGTLFDHPVLWNLEQVDFYGYSEKATDLCAVGGLMFRSELATEVPSTKNSTDWTGWKGLTNGNYIFHFEPKRDNYINYETTDGSYRAYFPPTFSPVSDLEVALKQGQQCDWEQSRAVIRATVLSGAHFAYTELKNYWSLIYQVSLLTSENCKASFPDCTYRGTSHWALLDSCIELAKAAQQGCVVRVDMELFQPRGHDGIRYSISGKTTFGVAISQLIAEKAFTPLLPGREARVYLSDVKFNGTATGQDCLFTKNHPLVYRNAIANDTPVNFSQWHEIPHLVEDGVDLYHVKLDPNASFTLAVAQGNRDCMIEQQSASLKVTYLY